MHGFPLGSCETGSLTITLWIRKCTKELNYLPKGSLDQIGNIFLSLSKSSPSYYHSEAVCGERSIQEVPPGIDFNMNFDTHEICFNYFLVKQILLIIFVSWNPFSCYYFPLAL